jgi:HAD superfamily hydrolase (TIGR01509 family)
MTNLKTILFDLDGVIIDSEPVHAKAKKLVLEKFNIPYTSSIFDEYKGRTDKVFFDFVSNDLDHMKRPSEVFYNSKRIIFENIITELSLVPGFMSFYQKVKDKGISMALVSSTSLYSLGLVDRQYDISKMFDLVITEVDTIRHKPEPDPYLKALQKLPADTATTIVIEDSPNGIISAKRAGCHVYALTSSFAPEVLAAAGADTIVNSYDELIKILGL